MGIGLSVPMIFDDKYVDSLILLNSNRSTNAYIKEVYGARKEDIIGNLRPSYTLQYVSDKILKKYIDKLHDNGIEFNYVINSTVSDGREYSEQGRKSILQFICMLRELGVDSFTITSSYYIRLLKKHFPEININASICNEIDNVQKAKEFENAGVNVIVLNRDINRNFKMIEAINNNVSCDIKVLCTTPCVYRCVDVHYHSNFSSVLSNNLQKYISVDEKNGVSHTSVNCMRKKLIDLEENIKSPWIRPEDMKYYEKIGVKLFKIDGRDRSAEYNLEIVNAYLNQKYDGNLLYLMKEGYPKDISEIENGQCNSYLRLGIDNRNLDNFILPFVNGKICCEYGCDGCGYCEKYSAMIKYDSNWMKGFLLFLDNELEKRYT